MKKDAVIETIQRLGGVVKTSELEKQGVTKNTLKRLTDQGVLSRIRHGYYQLATDESISESSLLAKLIPEAVVCVESALYFYGYNDFVPRKWSIAVPRSISLTKLKLDVVPIKAYFIQKSVFEIGKTTIFYGDTPLAAYDRERTICDCFKYRSRLDRETFAKALRAYADDERKNLNLLTAYAKQLGLYERVMNVMEAILGC